MASDTNKSILVIGGAGYIGSHTAKILQRRHRDVIILDNLSTGHKLAAVRANPKGPFYQGSYADMDLVTTILQKHNVDTVVHFGAKALVEESVKDPLLYYNDNVGGTVSLLKAMVETKTKKIIFSSTCATFGKHEVPLHEELAQNPVNPYGQSKLFVEKILMDCEAAYGIRAGILRYFNAAGADPEAELGEDHNPETHLIPNALKVVLGDAKKLTVFGDDYATVDGSCVRDYVHVNDLADAHIKMMDYLDNSTVGLDVNLGSGNGYSVLQVLRMIEEVTGQKLPYTIGPRREGDPAKLIANSAKAKRTLNWEAQFDLKAIVQTAYAWAKANPNGFPNSI